MKNKLFVLGLILIFLPSLVSAQLDFTITPKDVLFNFSNMAPGDSVWNTTKVENVGNMTIYKITVSTNFTNNCTEIEPNEECNWSGEGKPNLTDVLNCSFIYDGESILSKTITDLKYGADLSLPLEVGENKTLNITITFCPLAGNKYQATSAIVNFSFTALAPKIKINEIMYNPSIEQGRDDYSEWIEIYNPTNIPINLSGWRVCEKELLAGYINHTDSGGEGPYLDGGIILEPKQYAIITDGGSGTKVYQYFNVSNNSLALHVDASTLCNRLTNDKDTVYLYDDLGNLIDSVTYSDNWGADGNGKTLERKDVLGESNSSDNWGESIPKNGTPGKLNSIILWISDVSVSTGENLVNVSSNITHYFNLLNSQAWFVRESDNKTYIETLSTTDNQTYNGTWDTTGIGKGNYTLYIYAKDERLNPRLFYSGTIIEKSLPPEEYRVGGGHHVELRKSYLTITPTGATMEQNKTREFEIEVRNIGNRDIESFEVVAKDSEVENWINITPSEEKLGVGEIKFWTMEISVPEDAELGTKYFTIYAKGDELSLSTNFTLTTAKKPEVFIREEKPEIPENITGLAPTNLTVVINDGAETTNSRNVTLTLSATNATECRLNNDGISWSNWFNYTKTRDWTLSEAPGTKTVYYQCRNKFGNSTIVYDTIDFVAPKTTLPTGYAILTNPAVLGSIIGGILLAILAFLMYRRKLGMSKELK